MNKVLIIIGVFILVLIGIFLKSKNLTKNSLPVFNEDQATDFVYQRLDKDYPTVKRETIKLVIQKEWEWQYDNAPKASDGSISPVDRSDPRLQEFVIKEVAKTQTISNKILDLIFGYLADYEKMLTPQK